MEALTELVKFIQIGARLDLKAAALEHLLGKYKYVKCVFFTKDLQV